MPSLLALDCTDRACSVAVSRDGEILEIYLDEQRLHAKHLLGLIDECLSQAGLQKADLDGVVWARGPGSFTGLRIAAACVQGIAYGLEVPAMGVSSLLALALRAPQRKNPRPKIWVGLDARMGEVYMAIWQADFESWTFTPIENEQLQSSATLHLPADCDIYLGNALLLTETASLNGLLVPDMQIHAGDLLRLPQAYLQSMLCAPHQVEPVYLRRADAWKKMESNSSLR